MANMAKCNVYFAFCPEHIWRITTGDFLGHKASLTQWGDWKFKNSIILAGGNSSNHCFSFFVFFPASRLYTIPLEKIIAKEMS